MLAKIGIVCFCLLSLFFTMLSDSFQKPPIFLIIRNKLIWKTPNV